MRIEQGNDLIDKILSIGPVYWNAAHRLEKPTKRTFEKTFFTDKTGFNSCNVTDQNTHRKINPTGMWYYNDNVFLKIYRKTPLDFPSQDFVEKPADNFFHSGKVQQSRKATQYKKIRKHMSNTTLFYCWLSILKTKGYHATKEVNNSAKPTHNCPIQIPKSLLLHLQRAAIDDEKFPLHGCWRCVLRSRVFLLL